MRVLLIAAATSIKGGGEKHVADLLRGIRAAGVEAGLVSPAGGDLAELVAELGVTAYTAELDAGFSAARVRAVRTAIADFAPDVVHAHGSRAALFARLADPHARDRVVYTVHGIHADKAGGALRKVVFLGAERMLAPRTARFITVADSDIAKGERLGVLHGARARTIYNGIETPESYGGSGELRAELGLADDVPLVVSIGRFHEQKDHRTLIESFAILHAANPEARLALVGAGALEGSVREWIVARGLENAVRIVSPRADVSPLYEDADVIALSSLWEGLPYVILEAMAHRRPVVSTDVDGIPEAVENGVTGLLVGPSDPQALASAIGEILSDPERAKTMGEAGRAVVEERFTIERMVGEYITLYSELASTAGGLAR